MHIDTENSTKHMQTEYNNTLKEEIYKLGGRGLVLFLLKGWLKFSMS